jgi:hypothetical protein
MDPVMVVLWWLLEMYCGECGGGGDDGDGWSGDTGGVGWGTVGFGKVVLG